jgi:hypothetical protein
MLAELLAAHAKMSRGRTAHKKQPLQIKANSGPCPKVKRCHCGACPRCQEEARWERIFKERFADPDYYKDRPARFGSSMGWLGGGRAAT